LVEKGGNLAFYTGISLLISGVNLVIIQVNAKLVETIGFHFKSQSIRQMMFGTFISQFFNTGILLLLTNANFEKTFLSFIPINGEHSDFTTRWYLDMGPLIIKTMQISSVFPLISFLLLFMPKLLLRIYDGGIFYFRGPHATRKTSI